MKTVTANSSTITILLEPIERSILRCTIGMYGCGIGVSSVIRESHPRFLEHVNLPSLVKKLDGDLGSNKSPTSVEDIDLSQSLEAASTITLSPAEWGLSLFALNVVIFGCVASPMEVFASLGYHRAEIQVVMEKLHHEVEGYVYKVAANYKAAFRRGIKSNDSGNTSGCSVQE